MHNFIIYVSCIFLQVLGQDFCAHFIDTCLKLQAGQSVEFDTFDGFKKQKFEAFAKENAQLERITLKQVSENLICS